MSNPILTLESVCKEYPDSPQPLRVLRDVHLRLEPGECAAILGPSGCGKSTLLNLMGTLDQPSSGKIVLNGQDLGAIDETVRARLRGTDVGFVFQLHHLLPQCTVLENVLVPTMANPSTDSVHRAKALLERVGLSARAHHLPGKISGGERQRAAVVRAIINRPKLLLADEPTGSLNREGAHQLVELLLELNKSEGITLVLVTHSEEVAAMMGRVLELQQGTLIERTRRHE
ncbi:MAG: lipoprotein-releasing system ATP-binding protein LolD [Candidatus Hydrogenedentota bacterium]